MSEKLGTKIQTLRESFNLTRQELAAAAGIEEDQVRMIESDEVSPTISTLIKISRRMGVRLGTLLDGTEASSPVVTPAATLSPTIISTKPGTSGHLDFFSPAGNKFGRNIEPFFINVHFADPADRANWSSHEGEEFIYVLEGVLEVWYGKEKHEVRAGQSIYYDSIVPHCVTAPTAEAVVQVIAVTYTPN